MPDAVEIQLQMPKPVAEAWLLTLRSGRILTDYPALAGHKRTIGALQAALTAAQ